MRTLRTRLLLAYLVALIPLWVGFGLWAYSVARAALDEELGRSLHTAASVVASGYSSSTTAGRIARLEPDSDAMRERLRKGLEALRDDARLSRVRVLTPALDSLVDTAPVEPGQRYFDLEADRAEIERTAATGEGVSSVLFWSDEGVAYKRGYAAVHHEGAVVAIVCVEGPAEYFVQLVAFRRQLAGFGLLVLAAIVLVTVAVSRRVTAPLTELSVSARRIGEGDLHATIDVDSDDEVGQLARALGQMQRDLCARDDETQLMLAGIAHEVRNPLGGMELFLGTLEESLEPGTDQAEYATRVRRELAYLTRVVEEFLAFARDRTLDVRRARADGFVDGVQAAVGARDARGVTVECVLADADVEISGDLEALRGVCINLVQNAVQASSSGDTVRVRVDAPAADLRRITVEDSGPGMSAALQAQVMRPFFTTREKGTGLGLPLARKVVLRHGGALTLDSAEGRGTRVVVEPFDEGAPEQGAATGQSHISLDAGGYDGEMIG